MAQAAINDIDATLGETARVAADPNTKSFEPLTPSKIDDYRKRLGAYWRQARQTANSTNDYSDLRAMGKVQDAFDQIVSDAMKRKRLFNGNATQISQAWDDARAAHSALRQTFSPQGKGDTVGPVMAKIVGQRKGQAAPANQIQSWTTGQGGTPVLVGRRLQQIFGHTSPEIGSIKQSLFSQAVDPVEGMPALAPEKIADNLDKLRASELGRTYFSPQELARMRQHAIDLRNSVAEPRAKTDVVGAAIEKINGEGGQPWTTAELKGKMFGRDGMGDDPLGVKLAQHIKDTEGENSDAFRAAQRGQLSALLRGGEGRAGFDPEEISGRIRQFLSNKNMAETLFTQDQRDTLARYADRLDDHAGRAAAFEKANQTPGTNNPVERAIARITGRDGKPPATAQETVNMLMNRGSAADKTLGVNLARRLKTELTPEQFAGVKQGLFRRVIETGPDNSSPRIVKRIDDLLKHSPELVKEMYSPDDIAMMRAYQDMHRKLTVPQAGAQWSNHPAYLQKALRAITGFVAGSLAWHAGVPGEVAAGIGYGAARLQQGIGDARRAKEIARLMPIAGQQMAEYQKALAAAQRTRLGPYQKRAALAASSLQTTLGSMGLDLRALQGPGLAGAEQQQNQQDVPGKPPEKKHGGGVTQHDDATHHGSVGDSRQSKPETHPVITGARLAPDGEYYLRDPNRPGKYLKVVERGRSAAA
jgi:hypothetical protein